MDKTEETKVMSAEERKALREGIIPHLFNTSEAQEHLGVSRARVNQLVQEGKLISLTYGVFLKEDIEAYKIAFDDARANNKWLRDFE